jgi:putative restriction endonuclease
LRKTFEGNRPLIYLHGIVPGRYLAVWPVYIVSDNPDALTFEVALDDLASIETGVEPVMTIAEGTEARRAYLTMTVRQRMHQRSFRERVLDAYRSQCAFCRLRHRELLDAAHIIPDTAEEGKPVVTNGMALCKLHHAAFDSFILGVTPDYVIQVRQDILGEEDGPILKHGLQRLEGLKIQLPSDSRQWPSKDALAWKFEKFRRAA